MLTRDERALLPRRMGKGAGGTVMALCKRVIPVMLVRGRTLVKGQSFDSWRSIGHAAQAAGVHARRGVDELLILDISATKENRGPDLGLVRELSTSVFVPITVGGGVRSVDDINDLLRAGADKVAVCTAARERPEFITEASRHFGRQAITVVIEHDDESVREQAQAMDDAGAGELVLQARRRDGTLQGYDLDRIAETAASVSIPVIASGGAGGPEHMHEALLAGADAVAAGALFAFTDWTPRSCAQDLRKRGWSVRL